MISKASQTKPTQAKISIKKANPAIPGFVCFL